MPAWLRILLLVLLSRASLGLVCRCSHDYGGCQNRQCTASSDGGGACVFLPKLKVHMCANTATCERSGDSQCCVDEDFCNERLERESQPTEDQRVPPSSGTKIKCDCTDPDLSATRCRSRPSRSTDHTLRLGDRRGEYKCAVEDGWCAALFILLPPIGYREPRYERKHFCVKNISVCFDSRVQCCSSGKNCNIHALPGQQDRPNERRNPETTIRYSVTSPQPTVETMQGKRLQCHCSGGIGCVNGRCSVMDGACFQSHIHQLQEQRCVKNSSSEHCQNGVCCTTDLCNERLVDNNSPPRQPQKHACRCSNCPDEQCKTSGLCVAEVKLSTNTSFYHCVDDLGKGYLLCGFFFEKVTNRTQQRGGTSRFCCHGSHMCNRHHPGYRQAMESRPITCSCSDPASNKCQADKTCTTTTDGACFRKGNTTSCLDESETNQCQQDGQCCYDDHCNTKRITETVTSSSSSAELKVKPSSSQDDSKTSIVVIAVVAGVIVFFTLMAVCLIAHRLTTQQAKPHQSSTTVAPVFKTAPLPLSEPVKQGKVWFEQACRNSKHDVRTSTDSASAFSNGRLPNGVYDRISSSTKTRHEKPFLENSLGYDSLESDRPVTNTVIMQVSTL